MDYLEIIKNMEQRPEPRTSQDWLTAWREVAEVSAGLTKDDPRLERVMSWINVCDTAFILGSWPGFCEAAEEVREIVRNEKTWPRRN